MSIGMKGMLFGSKVMAATAMKLVEDPKLVEQAKEEFNKHPKYTPKRLKRSTYKLAVVPNNNCSVFIVISILSVGGQAFTLPENSHRK